MLRVDDEADVFVSALGRAFLRLPARYGAPLVHGGDFNAGKRSVKGEGGGSGLGSGLYARLTQRRVLRRAGEKPDSEDEREEARAPPLVVVHPLIIVVHPSS